MEDERRQALVFKVQQDIYFITSKCPVFVKTDGVLYCEPPLVLSLPNFITMKIIFTKTNTRERLTIVCEEEPRKLIHVRGHFRVACGRVVYIKPHYRKR